jgi:hypothetical protein
VKTLRSLAIGLTVACTFLMVQAQPVTYASDTVTVRAGVLLMRSPGGGIVPSGAPHIWAILDRDANVKPPEWRFDSGAGSGTLSTDAQARFGGVAGTPINKAYAPYWEVDLRLASDDAINAFDVLVVSLTNQVFLTAEDREKLRGFVDKGGLLWIDYAAIAGSFDNLGGSPVPVSLTGGSPLQQPNPFHPLILGPNRISLSDLYAMSDGTLNTSMTPPNFAPGGVGPIVGGVFNDGLRNEAVVTSGAGASVTVAQIGNGFVLQTSRGISRVLNRGINSLNNNALLLDPPRKDGAYQSGVKLIFNALAMRSRFAAPHGGSRNTGSNAVTIGVPAIKRFMAPTVGVPGKPLLANGRLITRVGGTVLVYDADPASDLNADGSPDDGVDDPVGEAYDRIWSSASLGTISDPTYVEVPGAAIVEQIWVQSSDGRLHGYALNQTGPVATPFASIDAPTPSALALTAGPFAPTFHEGVLYVADVNSTNQGRIWMVNPRMAADIAVGGGTVNEARNVDDDGAFPVNYSWVASGSGAFRSPSGGPALAWIPIADSSGGADLVAYVGVRRGTGATPAPPGLLSLQIATRGESPRSVQRAATALNITTRVAEKGVAVNILQGSRSPRGLTVRVILPTGQATLAQMNTYFTGAILQPSNGVIQLQIQAGQETAFDWDGTLTTTTADDVAYRLDYTVDYSAGSSLDQVLRSRVDFMDQASPTLDMNHPPVVSDSGNIGVILEGPNGGSFYNLKEEIRGQFNVKTRFEFHPQITNLGALGQTVSYPPALVDEDDLVNLFAPLNSPMRNMRPKGLAAAGDSFYVMVDGQKTVFGGIPTGALVSFKANPVDPEFIIDLGSSGGTNLLLKQPDMARSGYSGTPTLFSSIPASVFSIEPIPNSTRARIRMKSLASATTGSLNSCLANNLPVIVNRNGQTDTIIEPEAPADNGSIFRGFSGGRWSHVNWYTIMNGFQSQVGPVVAGGRLVAGGSSFLPSLVLNGFSGPPTGLDGLLFGIDSQISPNDTHLVSTAARPWVSQLNVIRGTTFATITPAKSIRWPEWRGITDIDDFRIRLLQASLLGENQFAGLAAGEGGIVITSTAGATLFRKSDFIVVDSGRMSRFDPGGNPLWSTDSTAETGFNQPQAGERVRTLSTPSRAYSDGSNGYVFADPGNNLVARIDASGRELRTIQKVRLHEDVFATTDPARPEQSPRGQAVNTGLALRNPQDVAFWSQNVSAADVQRLFPSEGAYRTYTNERWDNWLIADAGNSRVVQLIDRYELDANGRVQGVVRYRSALDNENGLAPALGILWWHTPEEFSGKRYAYNSIGRTTVDTVAGVRTAYAFGFGNVQPSKQTFGLDTNPVPTGDNGNRFGGVVLYDGPLTKVISEFVVPSIPVNTLMGTAGANFAFNLPARISQTIKVSGLQSVTVRYIDVGGTPVPTVMLSTDRGVYEVREFSTGPGTSEWRVIWMLPNEAYLFMRRPVGVFASYTPAQLGDNPAGFRAMHARRLDSGAVLVVNGYYGTKRDGSDFSGEILLVDGSVGNPADPRLPSYDPNRPNLGFNSLSVQFELPPVQGIRGIVRPVFAERQ